MQLFGHEIWLLDRYCWHCKKAVPGLDEQILQEVRDRLRQLDYLYGEIVRLERAMLLALSPGTSDRHVDENIHLFHHWSGPPDPEGAAWAIKKFDDEDVLRLSVETFYLISHRLLVILDEKRMALPGLNRIPAEGARRARNQLIEHSNDRAYTWSLSSVVGTRLRAGHWGGDPIPYYDEGIHANTAELRQELRASLESALAA